MKTMLLLLVGLAISAQTFTYSSLPFPSEYLTMVDHEAHLNGYWWRTATATEHQIYLMAWQDAIGHKVNGSIPYAEPGQVVPKDPPFIPRQLIFELSQPVGEAIKLMTPELRETSGQGSSHKNK